MWSNIIALALVFVGCILLLAAAQLIDALDTDRRYQTKLTTRLHRLTMIWIFVLIMSMVTIYFVDKYAIWTITVINLAVCVALFIVAIVLYKTRREVVVPPYRSPIR